MGNHVVTREKIAVLFCGPRIRIGVSPKPLRSRNNSPTTTNGNNGEASSRPSLLPVRPKRCPNPLIIQSLLSSLGVPKTLLILGLHDLLHVDCIQTPFRGHVRTIR
ncbi:hypothetical protein VTN77DRAFT_462 [Rasamsonia byssochlamydoides]|uniref:uncharacterized protein n=1 Tax=Rasamsonia byssochlamydoides TaxID=89139 RepID=UPI0037445EA7